MDLPLRYLTEAGAEPVISVDGAFGAPGLNLSHWPGNRTPAKLRRDLSTGIALAFAQLPAAERESLARGATAIVNNHFDTDGVLSLFAARHPTRALPRSAALLNAAAAGDFFRGFDERGYALDCIVGAAADRERSPIAAELAGLSEAERFLRATEFLFEHLPHLLDGDQALFSNLYEEPLATLRADLADLGAASKDDIAHLDLCVWTAAPNAKSKGRSAFDPGRHGLFHEVTRDRVLCVGPGTAGTTYRFILGTLSWFELVTRKCLPRASLEAIARDLNEREGTDGQADIAWRCQPTASPSPELWFGRAQHSMFAEHCAALEPSKMNSATVRRTIAEALRSVLVLPD